MNFHSLEVTEHFSDIRNDLSPSSAIENDNTMIDSYDRSTTTVNAVANSCLRDEFSFKTTSSSLVADHKTEVTRKVICRYGRGCTHMHDTCHRSKFWHPPMPALTGNTHLLLLLRIIICLTHALNII